MVGPIVESSPACLYAELTRSLAERADRLYHFASTQLEAKKVTLQREIAVRWSMPAISNLVEESENPS